MGSLFRQVSYPITSTILGGYSQKPRFTILSNLLFYATLYVLAWPGKTWFRCFVILLSPLLSAALMLRFLLVRHITEYMFDPIPPQIEPPSSSNRFCQVCRSTILTRLKVESGYISDSAKFPHHRRIRSLRKSATEGCRICSTLWHHLTLLKLKPTLGGYFNWRHATKFKGQYDCLLIHTKWARKLCAFGVLQDARLRDGLGGIYPMPMPKETFSGHTGSESSLMTAYGWYSKCLQEHPGCCAEGNPNFRPSRLLYLADYDNVILRTHSEYPEKLTYMTLSHCWGGAQFTRLQRNHEESFRQGIPRDSLPQTFQDAILISKRLGSEYLWIDSLCIIQDSLDDWTTESASMGDVYRNSMCNIAATDSSDSQEGCLFSRNPRIIQLERLPQSPTLEEDLYIFNMGNCEGKHELYTRAWVLQEALLAPRTLDCGRSQLFWRCDAMKASEEFPEGFPLIMGQGLVHPANSSFNNFRIKSLSSMRDDIKKWEGRKIQREEWVEEARARLGGKDPDMLRRIESYCKEPCDDSPGDHWNSIVELYSGMSLSVEADRLVAIAGVLDTFRPWLGEYWAGLWQNLMPGQLLWCIKLEASLPHLPHGSKRLAIQVPSWSWMSVAGEVSYRK
ncbi:heterokaryon incompatibility protein-domain-containing protein [Apiospora marii]|uniref:Heterokaryon incompatibility protein-domain-containing protein n=1 Tax=Apiospora marii TaxID=335849 RepID=A0ABR1RV44_9PEZI